MSYLYLDFCHNMKSGSKNWNDYFTSSILEQYKEIQNKIGLNSTSFDEFIASIFPTYTDKYYWISIPSFDRKIQKDKFNKDTVCNIVVRPEMDVNSNSIIPKKYDLILIGDLTFGTVVTITVKGIDLIDSKVVKYGEANIYCRAAFATSFRELNNGVQVPNFNVRDIKDSVLTVDFVNELCTGTKYYPVSDPENVIKIFDKWQKYISFRKYYLGKQSERCEEISNIVVCDSFIATRQAYRANEESYKEHLLDGISDFSKGDQIILDKNFPGTESFPLIRVDVEKNRKQILNETVSHFGNNKSKYESKLRRYTNESMALSQFEPKYDNKGNLTFGYKNSQYQLGERYLFTYVDIEPDCSNLENSFNEKCDQIKNRIDTKYAGIIASDLAHYLKEIKIQLNTKYEQLLADYQKQLNDSLARDIETNSDREIKREYDKQITICSRKFDVRISDLKKEAKSKIDKLRKSNKQDEIDEINKKLTADLELINSNKEKECSKINLREFYVARNEKNISNKQKSLQIQQQNELSKLEKDKKNQLNIQYKNDILGEKNAEIEECKKQFESDKAFKIENETIRRYQVYFKPDSLSDKASEIGKEIGKYELHYLVYDNRAEKSKIERQEKTLNLFMNGYVKNPFLASYLFSPEILAQAPTSVVDEPDWCLENLNENQKLAVRRALASDSIFLLQGPPGTGKTQVIAEITAQFAKQGKKVLISSETHKAIDNVFERLPKIPEIRPLRLIPSTRGKESNYSPENLVDNFYINICGNLNKQISIYENFQENKMIFNDQMKKLKDQHQRVLTLRGSTDNITQRINTIQKEINGRTGKLETFRSNISSLNESIDSIDRVIKNIELFRFACDPLYEDYIKDFKSDIGKLLNEFNSLKNIKIDKTNKLYFLDLNELESEIFQLLKDDSSAALIEEKDRIRSRMQQLRNPITDDPPEKGDENYSEYFELRKRLIEIVNSSSNNNSSDAFDVKSSMVYDLAPEIINNKELLRCFSNELKTFRIRALEIIEKHKAIIEKVKYPWVNDLDDLNTLKRVLEDEINQRKLKYEELTNDEKFNEYNELLSKLKQSITRFFADFNINREYDSNNLQTAFDVIDQEWRRMTRDFEDRNNQSNSRIPIYKEICKYLEKEDILEEDRQTYTKQLVDCVNVFGITCTSRDNFTAKNLSELEKYGIDKIDIKSEGIDVVIIDEVSKSSFLDLLIPILYGKTVILVGDHRQLPPMYDLRNMREGDFEGLDNLIINEKKNKELTELYEECFFKTLYEKVPNDYRVMLNKQYRCHSDIMDVFNHFYGGSKNGLSIGKAQQNDEKEHNLFVKLHGSTIIEPRHHIYFVDCNHKESSAYEGSTSKINVQEAEVAVRLIKELSDASEEMIKSNRIIVNKDKKIDERLSLGIICTYGDQAGLIKKKVRKQHFYGLSEKQDERLVISTVDDFQGDERDIIIVSMVRNPVRAESANADFIKKFERINVAFSRARKMLIIVGSKKYLSEAGIIDLPDLSGNHKLDKKDFHVYKEIIDTINFKGKVLLASDILEEE